MMRLTFIQLQQRVQLSNQACADYLGISEGAVVERHEGRAYPRRAELIALAVYGSTAEHQAALDIERLLTQFSEQKRQERKS